VHNISYGTFLLDLHSLLHDRVLKVFGFGRRTDKLFGLSILEEPFGRNALPSLVQPQIKEIKPSGTTVTQVSADTVSNIHMGTC
jgi:hypothetical protein